MQKCSTTRSLAEFVSAYAWMYLCFMWTCLTQVRCITCLTAAANIPPPLLQSPSHAHLLATAEARHNLFPSNRAWGSQCGDALWKELLCQSAVTKVQWEIASWGCVVRWRGCGRLVCPTIASVLCRATAYKETTPGPRMLLLTTVHSYCMSSFCYYVCTWHSDDTFIALLSLITVQLCLNAV